MPALLVGLWGWRAGWCVFGGGQRRAGRFRGIRRITVNAPPQHVPGGARGARTARPALQESSSRREPRDLLGECGPSGGEFGPGAAAVVGIVEARGDGAAEQGEAVGSEQ